jgi:hypothetical protein
MYSDKTNLEQPFPLWKPHKTLINLLEVYMDKKEVFKKFRSSSSGFIQNPILRGILLEKHNSKCALCGSIQKLQIDHIESVFRCFNENKFRFCDSKKNLQVLCMKCNTSKKP